MAALQHPESFVRWFRQVAPYLHAFRGRTFVVAFGGEMFAERARFASFIHDVSILAALGIRLVLVHGARPQIEAELKLRGIRSRYVQGLRITDERALQAVKEAAGVLRVEIEALLEQLKNWQPSDVLLMPEGIDAATLDRRAEWVAEICKRTGFRYCPRLHVYLYGHTRGT